MDYIITDAIFWRFYLSQYFGDFIHSFLRVHLEILCYIKYCSFKFIIYILCTSSISNKLHSIMHFSKHILNKDKIKKNSIIFINFRLPTNPNQLFLIGINQVKLTSKRNGWSIIISLILPSNSINDALTIASLINEVII